MKTLILNCFLAFCIFWSANGQVKVDVKGKTNDAVNNRANQRTDEGIDKGIDAVENGVKSLFKKKKEKTDDQQADKQEAGPSEGAENQSDGNSGVSMAPQPQTGSGTLQSYSKYDFVPGEKVIFYDDFSQDALADFPALWFSNGSGEVVTIDNFPGKWLNLKAEGCYYPEKDLNLGENFTVEFDLIPTSKEDNGFALGFYVVSGNIKDPTEGGAIPGKGGVKTTIKNNGIDLAAYSDGVYTGDASKEFEIHANEKVHLSYWIQKTRMRIYVNENKMVDAPRILPSGFKFNILRFENDDQSHFIANFRVAAGAPDTRSKLITEGKLVSYGIYFDVNKDVVKPESYGTLKDIAQVLKDNPTVRIKIIGHTDSDGDAAKNLDLSKRRGASVKNELVKTFGIDASRIESDGLGATKPIAPNDTPANKALNRRVEFIKL